MTPKPITITPEDVSNKMFLREQIATGTYGGREFAATSVIGSADIMVEMGGVQLIIRLRDLVGPALAQIAEALDGPTEETHDDTP